MYSSRPRLVQQAQLFWQANNKRTFEASYPQDEIVSKAVSGILRTRWGVNQELAASPAAEKFW
jgi:hypothetical protein